MKPSHITDRLPCWEKNRNFFDFLSHGVEIRFSDFRLRFCSGRCVPSSQLVADTWKTQRQTAFCTGPFVCGASLCVTSSAKRRLTMYGILQNVPACLSWRGSLPTHSVAYSWTTCSPISEAMSLISRLALLPSWIADLRR